MRRRIIWEAAVVFLLLVFFACVCLWQARINSATFDEPPHLAAGLSYWKWHDYRLNPEHPPLVKRLAALPLLWLEPWPGDRDLEDVGSPPGADSRSWKRLRGTWKATLSNMDAEWHFAHTLFYGLNDRALERLGVAASHEVDPTIRLAPSDFLNPTDRLFFWSRVPTILLGLGLAVLVFLWARSLHGGGGALLALTLFCFDPNFIAHSSLVTTDVAASLFFFGTFFFLWRWFGSPKPHHAIGFAVCFALAFCAKYSAIFLLPMVAVTGLLASLLRGSSGDEASAAPAGSRRRPGSFLALLAVAGIAAVLALWASYGFRHSATGETGEDLPLERTLRRTVATRDLLDRWPEVPSPQEFEQEVDAAPLGPGERILLLAGHSRLLPEGYVYGAAYTRMKSLARYSFLRGDVSLRGFPGYFLWTFLLKTPLLTLAAIVASTVLAIRTRRSRPGLLFLLLPALLYFGFALGSRFNIGHRHLLPVYPFLYVVCAGLVHAPPLRRLGSFGVGAAMAAVALSSSLVFAPPWKPTPVHPHTLAFFNEIAGGPRSGYLSLVDSNLDWGQDLKKLAQWLDQRGISQPIGLCYFGSGDPRFHGIAHYKLPGGYPYEPPFQGRASFADARRPGLVAISATNLQGVYLGPELRAAWRSFLEDAELVGSVGHSIFVYRIGGSGGDDADDRSPRVSR